MVESVIFPPPAEEKAWPGEGSLGLYPSKYQNSLEYIRHGSSVSIWKTKCDKSK